jgi:hypothetical protein
MSSSVIRMTHTRVAQPGPPTGDKPNHAAGNFSAREIIESDRSSNLLLSGVPIHSQGFEDSNKAVHGVKTPLVIVPASTILVIMNLLVVLIILMLLFGGGGFYLGGPMVGGGGFGLILLILLVLFFTGGLSRR